MKNIPQELYFNHLPFYEWIDPLVQREHVFYFPVGVKKVHYDLYHFLPGIEAIEFFRIEENGATIIKNLGFKINKFGLSIPRTIYYLDRLQELFPDSTGDKTIKIPSEIMEGQARYFINWANELATNLQEEGVPPVETKEHTAEQLELLSG